MCHLRSYGFFTTKKTEDPIKDNLPRQRHVLLLLVEKNKKTKKQKNKKKQQQQTAPHGEDKKTKQHEICMNIRNVYILV